MGSFLGSVFHFLGSGEPTSIKEMDTKINDPSKSNAFSPYILVTAGLLK